MDEFFLLDDPCVGGVVPTGRTTTAQPPVAPARNPPAGALLPRCDGESILTVASLPELRHAQQVLNEAARQASSFFRSCQAVMQLESPANNLTVASDSLAAQIVKQRTAQAALLPWTARTWHERLFEKQLRARMRCIADSDAVFLADSDDSRAIDTAMAISDAAGAVLESDPKLRAMRFRLVPKVVCENDFWARYFGECNRCACQLTAAHTRFPFYCCYCCE